MRQIAGDWTSGHWRVMVLGLIAVAASHLACAQDTRLPVPYPLKPVYGYEFSRQRVETHGVIFEWQPSRHLPSFKPGSYVLSVTHPSFPAVFRYTVPGDRSVSDFARFRINSKDIPGLVLTAPGRYDWGIDAIGYTDDNTGKVIHNSHSGLERGAHFFVVETGGDRPASLFDILPDHQRNSLDTLALAHVWKRLAGADPDYNPFADVGNLSAPPDGLIDELDLMALVKGRQKTRPRLLEPLDRQHLTVLQDFNLPPGKRFDWTDVPDAIGYFLEFDRRNDAGAYLIHGTFFVRRSDFQFWNGGLFPKHSDILRDFESNTMYVGFYRWRVRPVFLDGVGAPSEDEFMNVLGLGPTATPTPTPGPQDFLIQTLTVLSPLDGEIVPLTTWSAEQVMFSWLPARYAGGDGTVAGALVPDVTYVITAYGRLASGSTIDPFSVVTRATSIRNELRTNDSSKFPNISGSDATLWWRVYAYAPHPQNPRRTLYAAPSAERSLIIQVAGGIPYPGDVTGDRFTDAFDVVYLTRHYRTSITGFDYLGTPSPTPLPVGTPTATRLINAVQTVRAPLDINGDSIINIRDVLEITSFIRFGKFARPSLPEPTPVYPRSGQTVPLFGRADVTFRWTAVSGAQQYYLVIDLPPTVNEPRPRWVFSQAANSTVRNVTLPISIRPQVFSWQVRAVPPSRNGIGSNFCDMQQFSAQIVTPTPRSP